MATSLALAAPAALLAGAAYINARAQINNDYTLITGLLRSSLQIALKSRRDKLNLFYVLEQKALAKCTANDVSLMYEGTSWTFRELYDIVLAHGTWLKVTYAIEPKEVVAMDFMNSPTFIFLWFGLWSIGAKPAFINYNLTGKPLVHCVRTSSARIVFVDEQVRRNFTQDVMTTLATPPAQDGTAPVQTVFFNPEVQSQILVTKGIREPDSSRCGDVPPDMALLIFTSGTTGLPKAGIVSWQKMYSGGYFVSHWMGMSKHDRYYTCMPLYHSSAALLAWGASLLHGNALVLGHRFSTKTFWPEVRQHDATVIQYVGETCRYLLSAPPQIDPSTGADLDRAHSVTKAFGNGLRPDIWERFKSRFGIETIAEFYAATESPGASWNLSSNTFSSGAIGRFGSLSRWMLSRQVAIVEIDWNTETPLRTSPHGFGQRVKAGEPGELLIEIPANDIRQKFQGYFNNTSASEAKILRDVFVKGDAFFRSGDVIRWDNEGMWWFCDRIGDTFRWKSENVSTTEVSEALGAHPRVIEANVYGVQIPNHDGRAGCAAVLFQGPADQSLMDDMAKHAKTRLPKYAVPSFLRVVNAVTATGNNKQQKAALRNDGVQPSQMGDERMFWLRGDSYIPFDGSAWEDISAGKVRL